MQATKEHNQEEVALDLQELAALDVLQEQIEDTLVWGGIYGPRGPSAYPFAGQGPAQAEVTDQVPAQAEEQEADE